MSKVIFNLYYWHQRLDKVWYLFQSFSQQMFLVKEKLGAKNPGVCNRWICQHLETRTRKEFIPFWDKHATMPLTENSGLFRWADQLTTERSPRYPHVPFLSLYMRTLPSLPLFCLYVCFPNSLHSALRFFSPSSHIVRVNLVFHFSPLIFIFFLLQVVLPNFMYYLPTSFHFMLSSILN